MGLTTDRNDPGLRQICGDGQQEVYLVLSDEERAKGFVRPVRKRYRHAKCGTSTNMGQALSETYARNPHFYGGTFCCFCGTHFSLQNDDCEWQFFWTDDGEPVGSNEAEAELWREKQRSLEADKHRGTNI